MTRWEECSEEVIAMTQSNYVVRCPHFNGFPYTGMAAKELLTNFDTLLPSSTGSEGHATSFWRKDERGDPRHSRAPLQLFLYCEEADARKSEK